MVQNVEDKGYEIYKGRTRAYNKSKIKIHTWEIFISEFLARPKRIVSPLSELNEWVMNMLKHSEYESMSRILEWGIHLW